MKLILNKDKRGTAHETYSDSHSHNLPFFFVLWFTPAIIFNLGIIVAILLALAEFYTLNSDDISKLFSYTGMILGGLLALQFLVLLHFSAIISISLIIFILLSLNVLRTNAPSSREFCGISLTMFGIFYVAGILGQLILIRNMMLGRQLMSILILTVFAREQGARFGGLLFPQAKPISVSLNPKKSYIGGIVGLGLAVGVAVVFSHYVDVHMKLLQSIIFGGALNASKMSMRRDHSKRCVS